MKFPSEETKLAALDRHEWRQSAARCVRMDAGRTKVKVKVKD